MKPKNFPARKLERQLVAKQRQKGECRPFNDTELAQLEAARGIRTKKVRT